MQIDHEGHYEQNVKLGQRGSGEVTWPTFEIFWPASYLGNGWS